jgi:DNA topoisomerase-1
MGNMAVDISTHSRTQQDTTQHLTTQPHLRWRRKGSKERGFAYLNVQGKPIKDRRHIKRISALAIPPAWQDVVISSDPSAPLQAVGVDAAGRKQYRYHPEFRAQQEAAKFERLGSFAQRLPDLRRQVNADLALDGLGKDRVLALMIRLIEEAYFRIGDDRHTRQNKTFGITTLRKKHLKCHDEQEFCFIYVGKHGIKQRQVIVDPELNAILRELLDLPGHRLFQCIDADGKRQPITNRIVNTYIKEAMGEQYSAKDFRTWAGTLLAAEALAEMGSADTKRQQQHNIAAACKIVAEQLGNTPAVCRKSYISPQVWETYQQGKTLETFLPRAERIIKLRQLEQTPEEVALIKLLGFRI